MRKLFTFLENNPEEPSLEAMVKRMIIVGSEGTSADEMLPSLLQGTGAFIAFNVDYQKWKSQKGKPATEFPKNIVSPTQINNLNYALHKKFPGTLSLVDVEGGAPGQGVNRLSPHYKFPKTLSAKEIGQLIATGQENVAINNITQIALLVKNAGFHGTFAPVVDVDVFPESPAIGKLWRSASSDKEIVIRYAELFITIFQQHGLLTVLKHYPGHGSANGDTHHTITDVTKTWQSYEEDPYKRLCRKADAVMMSHIIHKELDPNFPASISYLMHERLRNLGFSGLIISDDLQMEGVRHAIAAYYKNDDEQFIFEKTLELAINSGTNLLLFGNQLQPYNADLTNQITKTVIRLVENKKINKERIVDSYNRIAECHQRLFNTNLRELDRKKSFSLPVLPVSTGLLASGVTFFGSRQLSAGLSSRARLASTVAAGLIAGELTAKLTQ